MKRLKVFLAGLSMLSFLLMPVAFAQQLPTGPPETSSGKAAQSQQELYANDVVGTSVMNSSGEKVGKVSELVIDPKEGRITEAVVSFGGFMGLGQKSVAVPWHELTLSPASKTFTLAMEKEELEKAPDWEKPAAELPQSSPQQRAPLGGTGQSGALPSRSQ
jgi:sporulation protein YlmC with PRC-barrel domain